LRHSFGALRLGYPGRMEPTDDKLGLEEFICEMGRDPVEMLTHERLMGLVQRLHLSKELVESRACFAEDQYARNLVCRTPSFELLVLCWRPGHESTIHNHAGALNAITVHRGELTSRVFVPAAGRPAGSGPVGLLNETRVAEGDQIGVGRGGVHQLANTSGHDLVTVHVYSPPLMELVVFSTESPTVERHPLRYTLAEDLD
jgi:cysteine dioxygenase